VKIFGMADPDPIVMPGLKELVSMNVLAWQKATESLKTISLNELQLTPRGRQMLLNNVLPAVTMQNKETFFYDPIRKCLLEKREVEFLQEGKPEIAVESEQFSEIFPQVAIESLLNSSKFIWKSPTSVIEGLEKKDAAIMWKTYEGSVNLDRNNISIRFANAARTEYINKLEPEYIYDNFLRLTEYELEIAQKLPVINLLKLNSEEYEIQPLQNAAANFMENSKFLFINHDSKQVSINSIKATRNKNIIIYNSPSSEKTHLQQADDTSGFLLKLNDKFPVDNCEMLNEKSKLQINNMRISIGALNFDMPVAIKKSAIDDSLNAKKLLSELAITLRSSGNSELALLPAIWEDQNQFWKNSQTLLTNLANSLENQALIKQLSETNTISKSLKKLAEIYQKLAAFLEQNKLSHLLKTEDYSQIIEKYKKNELGKFIKSWKIFYSQFAIALNEFDLNIENSRMSRLNKFLQQPNKFKKTSIIDHQNGYGNDERLEKVA
jgi:hypothetical protein